MYPRGELSCPDSQVFQGLLFSHAIAFFCDQFPTQRIGSREPHTWRNAELACRQVAVHDALLIALAFEDGQGGLGVVSSRMNVER
jgi:hypothetical protein